MKLALITLMSCLIAASWQQYQHQAANRYWSRLQQQLPYQYQQNNYANYYPYSAPTYRQRQQLAALLLSQISNEEAEQQNKPKEISRQKLLDLDLIEKLNQDTGLFITQQQDVNEPIKVFHFSFQKLFFKNLKFHLKAGR